MTDGLPQTGIAWVDALLAVLVEWGYGLTFLATVLENVFVVGSFTPGDTFVVAAAFTASRGALALPAVWAVTLLGTIAGSNISYVIGRRLGLGGVRALALRLSHTRIGRLARLDPSGVDDVEALFHFYGARTVFVSRFAIGVKNFISVTAGAARMGVVRFELYTIASALVYTSAMCLIGWFLGDNLDIALRVVYWIGWSGLTLVAALALALFLGRHRIRARWRDHKAERNHRLGGGEDGR